MTCEEKLQYLQKYKWSSLPGYVNKKKREDFVDYDLVLEEYGGDNDEGHQAYGDIISTDVSGSMDVKDKIVGQSIIGSEGFIEKVLERHLARDRDVREQPALRELHGLRMKEEIIGTVQEETGKGLEEIKRSKGMERIVLMDLLYRAGGLKGAEIARLMEVDYSTVSQGRKRLRERVRQDRKLKQVVSRLEIKLSQ